MTHATAALLLAPGDVVAGRYRVEASLGHGGFGAVFRAVETGLGRAVALKVLLPESFRDPAGVARFRREAELAQRLEHPNTVRLLDFGIFGDGLPFIAFELLRGRSLGAALALGPLSPERVSRVAAQVLKSLMEAHARGIVHRDIKPANVFLCDYPGERDFVKVLDFGIAKQLARGDGPASVALTREGEALGTPSYMAPEQVMGQPAAATMDLYALGLVMAEALTGRRVFDAASALEIARLQLSRDPVPLPPELLACELGPVVERATCKAAAERYASAGEMLQHLEAASRRLGDAGGRVLRSSRADAPIALPPTELAPPAPAAMGAPPAQVQLRAPGGAFGVGWRSRARLALFAALPALVGGGGMWLALRPGTPGPETRPWARAAPAPLHTRAGNPPLKSLETPQALSALVVDEGWEVMGTSSDFSGQAEAKILTVTCTIHRDTKGGVVALHRYASEQTAALSEGFYRSREIAYRRDGLRILEVVVFNDSRAAQQLLVAITR